MMLVGVSLSIFFLILYAPLSLSHVVTEFSKENCILFFLDETTPVIPGILHANNNQEQNRYQRICQKFNDAGQYTFATLYDTNNKIPVFSAYTYKGSYQFKVRRIWMYEPQLDKKQSALMQDCEKPFQATDKDYVNESADKSKYHVNRGHIFPMLHAYDEDTKSSTCTLTNIVPQKTTFNGGSWCAMENKVKELMDKHCSYNKPKPMAYVVTGAVPGQEKIKNRVNIPKFMWTAFCCEHKPGEWMSMAHWAENVDEDINNPNKKTISPITLDNLHDNLKNHYSSKYNDLPKVFPDKCKKLFEGSSGGSESSSGGSESQCDDDNFCDTPPEQPSWMSKLKKVFECNLM